MEITILGIETSCDDTAISVLRADENGSFKVLSNVISSQIEIHKQYGGVYPMLAKREHQKNLAPTLELALKKAKINNKKIDLIATTVGPGLEPCLWTGINFAKELAKEWNLPIVPVNHIEAHILVNLPKNFPAICLVVSGGHTQIILMEKIGKYKILGETRDDAAGECFDKTAKILGLPYPGGPAIAKLAAKLSGCQTPAQLACRLPRPMILTNDYDFSFSGLKTAVLYDFIKRERAVQKDKKYIQEMAAEIQQAIIDVLIKKTIKATKDYRAKSIILGGGVSANKELRKQLKQKIKEKLPLDTKYLIPDTALSTDNALMTAIAGYYNRKSATKNWQALEAKANLRL